jgi:hypothetical protein
MHKEELHDLYSLPSIKIDQVKEYEMGGACNMNEGEEGCV